MTPRRPTRSDFIDYYLEGCKPREEWLVGMEVEKSGVDARTGLALPYEGAPASVRAVLDAYLALRGGSPVFEGRNPIGIAGDWGTISLEPGGQIEWSSPPVPRLDLLEDALNAHLVALDECGRRVGVRWLDVAVVPDQPVATMPWMPKHRYEIMRDHLGARGPLAHRMMTQTTSIQCAFDFDGPADWTRKFLAGSILAPIAVALFANSARADGRDSGYRSFREAIWRETDPERCGLPAIVFADGFGWDAWVDWAMKVPAIFERTPHGLVEAHGETFEALLARRGHEMDLEDWELHLSTIFTEVRSYQYTEVRSADLQPDRRILAVPSFWTGILYHLEGPAEAIALAGSRPTHAGWTRAMDEAGRFALDGGAYGRPLRELAREALALSIHGLRNGAACASSEPDPARVLLAFASELGLPVATDMP